MVDATHHSKHKHHPHSTIGAVFGLQHHLQFLAGQQVFIQNFRQLYLGKHNGLNENLELTDHAQGWEKFVLEQRPNGKWSLKQVESGLYLGAHKDKGQRPALTNHAKEWEEFVLEPAGTTGDQYAIKNVANNYLGAVDNIGQFPAWTDHAQEWEWWRFIPATQPVQQAIPANTVLTISHPISVLTGQKVSFQNFRGFTLGGEKNKGDKLKLQPHAQGWEYFNVEALPNGKYALRQVESGLYLGGNKGKGEHPVLTDHRQAWEEFTLVPIQNGATNQWAIQNVDGLYLGGCEQQGHEPVWTEHAQEWEWWRIVAH